VSPRLIRSDIRNDPGHPLLLDGEAQKQLADG
jgi:hypothetical protein